MTPVTVEVGGSSPLMYIFRRLPPPQNSVLLPLQSVVHPLVAGAPPLEILFPQSVEVSVAPLWKASRELTAFAAIFHTRVLVTRSITGGCALVHRHVCAWDGTNSEGKGSTRCSLRIATKMGKAIDTRVRLRSDSGRAVKDG